MLTQIILFVSSEVCVCVRFFYKCLLDSNGLVEEEIQAGLLGQMYRLAEDGGVGVF